MFSGKEKLTVWENPLVGKHTRSPATPIELLSASVPVNIGESVTLADRVNAAAMATSAITPL